jgi:hypothetical protein
MQNSRNSRLVNRCQTLADASQIILPLSCFDEHCQIKSAAAAQSLTEQATQLGQAVGVFKLSAQAMNDAGRPQLLRLNMRQPGKLLGEAVFRCFFVRPGAHRCGSIHGQRQISQPFQIASSSIL